MVSGHPPLHLGYVLFNWPLFHFLSFIKVNPIPIMGLLQVVMGLVTILFFGRVIEDLSHKKIAKRAMILAGLLPIYWIVNETVMMETTYLFFFFGSLFFLRRNTLIACVFWLLAFLTHTVVLIWIPLVLYLAWMWNRKQLGRVVIAGVATLIIASLINAYFLSLSMGTDIGGGLYWLYAAKYGEHAWFALSPETMFRYARNWLVPLVYNNTSIIVFVGGLSWFGLWRKKGELFWLGLLWLMPSFVANQWWDSLLYGRHSLIAGFGLAFFAAVLLKGVWFRLVAGLVLIISLSSLVWLKKPIPYNLMAEQIAGLQSGGLVIDSHFARPYTDKMYSGEMIFVDEPGWSLTETEQKIEDAVGEGKTVYVTGHAMSEPYGLFSGPYLHPLSLSYRYDFRLETLTKKWSFVKEITIDPELNLVIYRVVPVGGIYEKPNRLNTNRRRLDYFDPLTLFLRMAK